VAALIQPEDRGGVNPVPAFRFLSLFSQGFSAAPGSAFPDIPSVQFQDEHKRPGGRDGLPGQLLNSFGGGGALLIGRLASQRPLSLAERLAMERGGAQGTAAQPGE
jgi:hypothetical protein